MTSHRNSAYIVIQAERCKGCRLCMLICPSGIIVPAPGINQAGYTPAMVIEEKAKECTGCIACALMCPDTAIFVYRRSKVATKPAS